jgi:cytochrome c553
MRSTIAISLLLCFHLACKAEDQPAKQQGPSKREQPAPPELGMTMTEHFVHASALEQSVIDGDLENAKIHADWLVSELPVQALPNTWQPSLERMQAAAREVSKTEDLAAAATATGKVIETCGACHAALGAGPKFGPVPPLPEGESGPARMQRHQWAAQRMREGMIGPSDERWQLGASAVSVAPPEPCPIENAEVLPKDVLQLREKIYELGARAAVTKTAEDRAVVYGEYLSTCAGCHVGGC